ncbi:MAG TPA: GLPGLI family protein [Chitinophagaceae bacterium]|nr:GLPGLI family protein [Chitinophagaceae bacterium]
MRKIWTLSFLLFSVLLASAQMKQGKIIYERTSKINVQVSDPAFANMIPPERKEKFELHFADNKTLWRPVEEGQEPEMNFDNGGAQIRLVMPGSNDVMFSDIPSKRKVEQRELFTKTFVVEDSIRSYNWKIGQETKAILGHSCRKATSQRTQQATRVNMDNGVMKREQFTDTVNVVAWFTDAISVFAGPDLYQGQLPGTILELDVNNGRTTYVALSITPDADVKNIKEPKGKKITPAEFAAEREKMMQEMEKNNGGGNVNIRVGQ